MRLIAAGILSIAIGGFSGLLCLAIMFDYLKWWIGTGLDYVPTTVGVAVGLLSAVLMIRDIRSPSCTRPTPQDNIERSKT
jgi:hypothetical protein